MKRKTMTQRRAEFFASINALISAVDRAAYLQGCRAADPACHDTDEVRQREDHARNRAHEAHMKIITQFNAAVRAAGRKQ